jgi:hypothetical protein
LSPAHKQLANCSQAAETAAHTMAAAAAVMLRALV